MKNVSKWLTMIVFFGCGLLYQVDGTAQKSKTITGEDYSRLSVVFFLGNYEGESVSQEAVVAAEKIKFSDKYNNHNLKGFSLPLSQDFKAMTLANKRTYLKDLIEKQGIGKAMVAKWFNRQENGTMNLDYVHQSGLYNATDQDVKIAATAKRGDAFLKDAGQNLVNKSYVLILVPTELKSNDDGKTRGWNSTYDLFLFKLQFTPEVIATFYNVWPYDDDDATLKTSKVAAFDTLSFKFSDVYSKSLLSASTVETLTSKKNPKSLSQLMDELINSMYQNSTFLLDKDLEDFRVKAKVSKISPTRAKIGKKEGLKCDQQFFVYQYKWNEKSGKAEPNRQAVVRSSGSIADNRQVATGSSPESRFYQTYGGTIKEGMILQQRLDLGFSTIAGYEIGGIGGVDVNFMIRTGPFTNVTSLYLMIDLGLDTKEYTAPYFTVDGKKEFTFLRGSVGLGKGIRLGRIIELTPYAQYGIEQISDEKLKYKANSTTAEVEYKSISTGFIKAGAMLGINLTRNISILGQVNYYSPSGDISTKDKADKKGTIPGVTWTKAFEGREGMGIMGGIRIEF